MDGRWMERNKTTYRFAIVLNPSVFAEKGRRQTQRQSQFKGETVNSRWKKNRSLSCDKYTQMIITLPITIYNSQLFSIDTHWIDADYNLGKVLHGLLYRLQLFIRLNLEPIIVQKIEIIFNFSAV
jgi:hypothetical protein